jgi:hypothetical protein
MDGVGPHTAKTLLNGITSEFGKAWLDTFVSVIEFSIDECQGLLYLSSNFGSGDTAKQGLKNGSLLVDNERALVLLYIQEVFEELPSEMIARAYAIHHQVANVISDNQGVAMLWFGIRERCTLE